MIEDQKYWEDRLPDDNRRDWRNGANDWIEEYIQSKEHPHRQLIIDEIGHLEPFEKILEVGCSAGPNIALLREKFAYLKDSNLTGVDVNAASLMAAKINLPAVNWMPGSVTDLPLPDKSVDITLVDAVLMYVGPEEIEKAMDEINRVTKKAVVLVEWGTGESTKGILRCGHWARSYGTLLEERGFKTFARKLTFSQWPNENWANNGYIYTSVRR